MLGKRFWFDGTIRGPSHVAGTGGSKWPMHENSWRRKTASRGEYLTSQYQSTNEGTNLNDIKAPGHVVKVCGVTSAEDAQLAASAGATHIGMILWPKAKRSVSLEVAKDIAETAKKFGAEAVGVFVDESASQIDDVCKVVGIDVAQLHGDPARNAASEVSTDLRLIYVLQCDTEGNLVSPTPKIPVDWLLLDGIQGGSGTKIKWTNLQPPVEFSKKGWILAGGLNPNNVSEAIFTTHPTGVDVSSGVCTCNGLKKDPEKVLTYVRNAWESFKQL